jgi:hypothetical protein
MPGWEITFAHAEFGHELMVDGYPVHNSAPNMSDVLQNEIVSEAFMMLFVDMVTSIGVEQVEP